MLTKRLRCISACKKGAQILVAVIGLIGCTSTEVSDFEVLCGYLDRPVAQLSDALAAHPETPAAVGEAGTDVVITAQSGCDEQR